MHLETERLIIRPIAPEDAHDCFAITSDPRVLAMMVATELHTTIEQAEQYIAEIRVQYEKDNTGLWAVVEKGSKKVIGLCGLIEYKARFRRAELCYMFAYDVWGKGYATEACRAVADYGFEVMNLNRIEAPVDPENIASIHVLKKLGMQCEGLLRQRVISNGQPRDRNMYGLLKEDLYRKKSPMERD